LTSEHWHIYLFVWRFALWRRTKKNEHDNIMRYKLLHLFCIASK